MRRLLVTGGAGFIGAGEGRTVRSVIMSDFFSQPVEYQEILRSGTLRGEPVDPL